MKQTNSEISKICRLGWRKTGCGRMGQRYGKLGHGKRGLGGKRGQRTMEPGRRRMEPGMGTTACRLVCTLACRPETGKLGQICRRMAMSRLEHIRP